MESFRLLHSHLKVLSINDLKRPGSKGGYERAFASLFDQDVQTFTGTMLLNLDQLEQQLDKEEFQEIGSMDAFRVLMTQFLTFIQEQYYFVGFDDLMISKYFLAYTRTEHESLVTESTTLEANLSMDVNALDVGLAVTESNGTNSYKQDTSSSSGTYITHIVDADIRPVNDQVPSAEVHLTAQHNFLANAQQHIDQSEPSYDTYLLEKVDRNTTPDATNMCHRGGEIDQDAEQDLVKNPLLNAEFLKTNDMVEKEVYNELSNRFLQLEKHCISLEISMQQKEESFQSNKPCKNQDSPDVKEASNEAKVKHDIVVLETINIELESSVAKLLAENEKLNKENEHLKQTYKELYDSIKKTRTQTKDHNDSLIAQVNSKTVENADLKAQIQEKFASQVDVNNVLSKPVTPHYLPKVQEYVLAKPHHVITPGSSRNSQEEPYGSNDMTHNHYLEEARKKTQERNRNSKPSVMHTTSLQNTTNGSKPNPRSNNQISRVCLTQRVSCECQIEVNSRAKVQSPKTRNNTKPVGPKSHTQKPSRQIAIGQRFSPKKSFAVHEKPNTPRSCLRKHYRLERETFSKTTEFRRILSSTFISYIQEPNFDRGIHVASANFPFITIKQSRADSSSLKITPGMTTSSLKPDLAMDLGNSISLTLKPEEEAIAREVHAYFMQRIVSVPDPEPSRRPD
ncbi:hypothetical protein Tco_1203639 [Tanacetum coccineum]